MKTKSEIQIEEVTKFAFPRHETNPGAVSSVKVLLVEDNEDDHHLIRALLSEARGAGYRLEWEPDFEAAMDRVRGFPHDVYLIDHHLGERNGLELIEAMVRKGCRKPILLLAGRGDDAIDALALHTGASDYLDKADLNASLLDRSIRHALWRKRVEAAIVQAKKEWEHIFDAVPDPIAIIDREHRLVRVNKAMADRLGTKPQCLVGRTCFEAVHGLTSPPPFCPHAQVLEDGQEHSVELYEERLHGYFLVTATPYYDERSRLMVSIHVARDISALKNAENALRMQKERLEQLVAERTSHLEEMNAALRVLLRQRDEDKRELEESVLCNIRTGVAPSIEKLRSTGLSTLQSTHLDILEAHLERITSPFARCLSEKFAGLTPMEMQVLTLVRDGKTSKEIAQLLNISKNTVNFHRLNLRCKLGLRGTRTSLKTCLDSLPS
jgi:PAS domain S-box-containing protein